MLKNVNLNKIDNIIILLFYYFIIFIYHLSYLIFKYTYKLITYYI